MTPVRLDRFSWPSVTRTARIVHIGIGNFARAHQAWYTMRADPAGEWGVAAFTGRDRRIADVLTRQGGLYTLIERGPDRDRLEVVDSVSTVSPAGDLAGLIAALAAPRTAVVTLTVTEAGYGEAPAGSELPSVPERLALGLSARREASSGPLAIVSCDNIHLNGNALRGVTLAAADRVDCALPGWIEREVSFVNTSVDRVTPRAEATDRLLVERELDRIDDAPVVCEPFTDWVLCGEFPAGRPRWEDAGARFVSDIEPWELRKLWLLNGGHSLLAYMGLLSGHLSVADGYGDRELQGALARFWDLAARHLPGRDLDLQAYRRQLMERFANARIGYPLAQIASDGLAKLRNRVVPVIAAATSTGDSPDAALLVIAAWAQWLDGVPDLSAVDASAEELRPLLASARGAARTRALLELLASGCGEREELVALTERLRVALTRTV
jgi:fructuronate reductase